MTSTPVSELVAVVFVAGVPHKPDSARVQLDSGWSPYAAASLVLPYTAALAGQLDPRTGSRIGVRIERRWQGTTALADLSSEYAGKTLTDLSSEYAGKTLADLTAKYGTAWQSGWRAADVLDLDLSVRQSTVDYGADTITVRATSDELLAQDPRVSLTLPAGPLPDQVLTLLAAAGVPVLASDFTAGAIFVAMPALVVDYTKSPWQVAQDLCTSKGLRLWCDEARVWRMAASDAAPTVTRSLTRAVSASDDVNRDSDFADAIVWHGTGTNSDGLAISTTVWWPDPVPVGAKVAYHDVQYGQVGAGVPVPSTTELAARVARTASLARSTTLTAVADPLVRPGDQLSTGAPSLPALTTVVSRVEWTLPDDVMTLTTRSTEA